MTGKLGPGPTVIRMVLGAHLRRLREARGISRGAAGHEIRASESKMSRLELGRVGCKYRDVEDLLTFYEVVDEAERAPILALARDANKPGWWRGFADVLPNWFELYLGLESAATVIRIYEAQFIPGLLQTEDYARALIAQSAADGVVAVEGIEPRVRMRLKRQEILAQPHPPQLWAVLDEAVVRRQVGGPAVMRAQLKHLIALSEQPNLTIQVMPLGFGAHHAEGGAFTILRFAEPELSDVVYLEYLTDAVYVDKPQDVDFYSEAMDRLAGNSTLPATFARFLEKITAGM